MEIDKYFHMYGTKDKILFEEVEKPEQRWIPCSEPVGCNGCIYDWFGNPICAKCARSFQDYYEADMRGDGK